MKNLFFKVSIGLFIVVCGLGYLLVKTHQQSKLNYSKYNQWKDNYITAQKGFYLEKLKNDELVYKLGVIQLNNKELMYSKDLELNSLKDKLKKNLIKEEELSSALLMKMNIIDTLISYIDSTNVELLFKDDLITLLKLNDSTYVINIDVELDAFVSYVKQLYKPIEDRNFIGRWWVNTKLGFKWSKKYDLPEVQINTNDKRIKITNVKYYKNDPK